MGISWLGLGILLSLTPGPVPVVSEGIDVAIDEALALSRRRYTGDFDDDAKFDELLGQIAKLTRPVDGDAKSDDLPARLVRIALDRVAHPETYQAIARYMEGPESFPPKHIHVGPLAVLPMHAQEPFRLAWEYFTLRPASNLAFEGGHTIMRLLEAFDGIRNDASLVVLVEWFRQTTASDSRVGPGVQRDLLRLLRGFPTEAGLQALLGCLEAAASAPPSKYEASDWEVWNQRDVIRWLSDPNDDLGRIRPPASTWRTTVENYPRQGLADWQTAFLERLLVALEKAEQTERKPTPSTEAPATGTGK